jgi:hypothetical protein
MSFEEYMKLYSQAKQRLTGVIYFVLHGRGKKINMLKFAQLLEGTLETVRFEPKGEEDENIIVPKMFTKKGEVILQSRIDKVVPTEASLFGKATVDAPIRIRFRKKKLLIVGTTEIYFLIFRDEPSKEYFLVLLSSRAKSNELYQTLASHFKRLGLATSPSKLEHEKIEEIRKKMRGSLTYTTLGNFPTPKITKKGIWGAGFQDEPSYLADAQAGSIYQNQFVFRDRHNERNVVTVSDDGLIRFYNNISYKDYEWFLRENIVQFLKQTKKPEIPSLLSYTFEDLFVDEE